MQHAALPPEGLSFMPSIKIKQALIIVSGPSGAGKSTLIADVIKNSGGILQKPLSCTTRPPRGENQAGYQFLPLKQFESLKNQGLLAEWAFVYGFYYGTPLKALHQIWEKGQAVITDLDTQGAKLLKSRFPQALRVFILPPSLTDLKNRILERRQNSPQELSMRLSQAQKEIQQAPAFDHQVVNKDRPAAAQKIKFFIDQYLFPPLN